MRAIAATALVLLCAAGSGCRFAAPARPYAADKAPDPQSGYLYGRLSLRAKSASRLLLVVENLDLERAYYLRFEADGAKSLLAVAVPPGNYRISRVLFTLPGAAVHWQGYREIRIDRPEISAPFLVQAGRCAYLGDFRGAIQERARETEFSGGLEEIAHAFDKTTADFGARYPRLLSCPRFPAWNPGPGP